MIFRTQPTKKWNNWDFALIEAFQILDDEVCKQCGNPVWLCRSNSNKFEFRVKEEVCYASRKLEQVKDGKKKTKDRAPKSDRDNFGKYYYAVPALYPFEDTMPTSADFIAEKASLVN